MEEKPRIRIGHMKIVDHLILGLAGLRLETGEYHLESCTLHPLAMNSWEQIRDALISRQIDGAFITAPLAMDIFSSGLDTRLLMFTHRSGSTIVRKAGSDVKSIADFKGKTVLVPSELSIQNMLLHRLLSTISLKLGPHNDQNADVFYEVIPPFLMSEMLAGDTDNDIAGFAVSEPYGSEAILNKSAKKICNTRDLWNNHPCCCFVVNTSVMEDHRFALSEIIDLFLHTAQDLKSADNKNVLSDAQKFLHQKEQVIQEILSDQAIRFDPPLLVPDIQALETIAGYMKNSLGLLDRDIDMKNFVDDTFILNSTLLDSTADIKN